MFYGKIRKEALNCNKGQYIRSISIPVFSALILILLTALPLAIRQIADFCNFFVPKNYSYLIMLLKCVLLFAVGFAASVFYCTVNLGEEALYSGRYANKKHCFKRFIYWFRPSRSIKAFALRFTVFLLKLFWTLVFLLPSIVTSALIFGIAFSGGIEIYLMLSLLCGTLVLLAVGLIFRFIMIQRYFLAEFILSEKPDTGVIRCIKQSKNLLDGQMMKVVKFKLSFLPLRILCILIFPLFFVYPHYKQSRSILAKELMI